MEKYLGVKLVEAEECSLSKFSVILSSEIDQHGYKIVYEDGYISWSPKEVFEKAYRKIKIWNQKVKFDGENQDYMTRVVVEAEELQKKIIKLNTFIETNHDGVNPEELIRLKQQLMAMQYYLTILVERIENF